MCKGMLKPEKLQKIDNLGTAAAAKKTQYCENFHKLVRNEKCISNNKEHLLVKMYSANNSNM